MEEPKIRCNLEGPQREQYIRNMRIMAAAFGVAYNLRIMDIFIQKDEKIRNVVTIAIRMKNEDKTADM